MKWLCVDDIMLKSEKYLSLPAITSLKKTMTTATHINNDNCSSQKQWQLQLTKTTTAAHINNDNCNSQKQQLQLT